MTSMRASRSAVIAAPPAVVYAILADYRIDHPRILPKPYFTGLDVVHGGVGAGTELRLTMRVAGRDHAFRQRVEEPEPGRVLVERDLDSGLTTTFTMMPHAGAGHTHICIETVWTSGAGLRGWVEAHLTALMLRFIYTRELRLLADYAVQKHSQTA